MDVNLFVLFCVLQLGTFRSPEGEYFVEPLHHYQGEHYEEEHTKPHVVYRKKAPKQQTSGESSACDTSGTQDGTVCTFYSSDIKDADAWTKTVLYECVEVKSEKNVYIQTFCVKQTILLLVSAQSTLWNL